jgi:hypothetical protein
MLAESRFLFCVDLKECASMDSTFIGTLVMLATEDAPQTPTVRLLNVRENVREQLTDLGVSRVFEFGSSEQAAVPSPGLTEENVAGDACREKLNQTMLRAHEALVRLSPTNELKFKDVIAFLREERSTN